jgi:transposase
LHLVRGKDKDLNLWIALAICRIVKRFGLSWTKSARKQKRSLTTFNG